MKKHDPAGTRILERFERFTENPMSRSFFDQLPGRVPLDFNDPAGSAEIEPSKSCRVPVPPASRPDKPSNGTWAPLIYKGA